MIAEGDDAFGGKVVFEGIDQEICFEQNRENILSVSA